jgi:cell wall-associated NlpC family hydrolase
MDASVTTQAVSAPGDYVAAVLAAAQQAIGTPYKSAGTTLAGFDCSGLTQWAFKQAGITLPRTSFDQYKQGESIPKDQIQVGDLVFFDSAGAGASHVGIATGPTKVISATTKGVMEHTIASGYWASHYVGARRITAAVKASTR